MMPPRDISISPVVIPACLLQAGRNDCQGMTASELRLLAVIPASAGMPARLWLGWTVYHSTSAPNLNVRGMPCCNQFAGTPLVCQ